MEKKRTNGYKLLLGRLQLEENFWQWEQSAIGIISPRKWWIPQHWTLLGFGWTGCWATLSRQGFCQERLEQMILEVSSSLVFDDSMILFHQSNVINSLQKQLSSPHNYMYMGLCKPIWASNDLWHTLHLFVAGGIPNFSSVSMCQDRSKDKNVLVLT